MNDAKTPPITVKEWHAEAVRLFGANPRHWRFICPGCQHVASVQDWLDAGAPEGAIAFSCIGRYRGQKRVWLGGEGPGPCDYAGGGLFGINPIAVIDENGETHFRFAFAPVEEAAL